MTVKNIFDQLWPANIREAKDSAPDEPPIESDELSQFAFPVHSGVAPRLEEWMLIGFFGLLFLATSMLQFFLKSNVHAHQGEQLGFGTIIAIGCYCLLFTEAKRSLRDHIFVVASVFLLGFFFVVIKTWELFLGIGAIGGCFLLDRFLVHNVAIRSAVPATIEQAEEIEESLEDRFSWMPNFRHSVWTYLLPLALYLWATTSVRYDFEKRPETGLRELPMLILAALVIYPWVVDRLAPFMGGKRYGFDVLLSEFWAAVQSWLTYNWKGAKHPAVFESAGGTAWQRKLCLFGALILFIPSAMPRHFFLLDLDKQHKQYIERRMDLQHILNEKRKGRGDDPVLPQLKTSEEMKHFDPEIDDFESDFLNDYQSESEEEVYFVAFQNGELNPRQRQDIEEVERRVREAREKTEAAKQDLYFEAQRRGTMTSPTRLLGFFGNVVLFVTIPCVPFLTLVAFLFAGSARTFAAWSDEGLPIPTDNIYTTENLPRILQRLRQSDGGERNTDLLWALSANEQTPVVVPREILREHVHFLGDTGSGKTSLGISPIVSQLLASGDCSVVVLDLKGDDQSLFELVRDGARRRSGASDDIDSTEWDYPFRYFSVADGKASHIFNPLRQRAYQESSLIQRADLISTGLGLQYGTDYGRKYFSDANFNFLQAALSVDPDVSSFAGLLPTLSQGKLKGIDAETRRAASNLKTSVQRLSGVGSLNVVTGEGPEEFPDAANIDLIDIFEKPQALFFSLPAATGSVVSADIARLVLFSIINAAQKAAKPRKQVFVVIDEFQRVVSENIAVLMQMARSHDVGLLLANQSLSDLNQGGTDITAAVTNNTRIRQIFGISDPEELKKLAQSSGEKMVMSRAFEMAKDWLLFGTGLFGGMIIRTTMQETISTRLRVNDLIEASDHPFRSILLLRRGEGLARFQGYPFIIESVFHIDQEEYRRRLNAPWPEPSGTAKVAQPPHIETSPEKDEKPPVAAPAPAGEVQRLLKILDGEPDAPPEADSTDSPEL